MLPWNRFSEFAVPTDAERRAIEVLIDPPMTFQKGQRLRSEGDRSEAVFLLRTGWFAASVALPSGERQIVKLQLPGDLMGSPSMALQHAAETLTALSPSSVSAIPHERLMGLFTTAPRIAAMMFLSAQRERVALMDMLTAVGRSSALSRMASLLLELYRRLSLIGMASDYQLEVPLTQDQLADVVGVTAVHVNRVLRELETRGLIERRMHHITLIDIEALGEIAAPLDRRHVRDPDWLPPPLVD